MVALSKAYFLALCLKAAAKLSHDVVIVGDTDRNGVFDDNDLAGRAQWTDDRGAIFMANIGDASGECTRQITDKTTDEDMKQCNDARDDIQRNPKYLAHVKIRPLVDASEHSSGFIVIHHDDEDQTDEAQKNVRVFRRIGDETQDNAWHLVTVETRFSAEDLNAGVELGVDSRGFRTKTWDGLVKLSLIVTEITNDGKEEEEYQDEIVLRVAPLMIHHNLQKLDKVYTVASDMVDEKFRKAKQEQFVREVTGYTQAEVKEGNVVQFHDPNRWVQDWFESGYTSMPGIGGEPVVLRVMVRSTRIKNPQDRNVFTEMRSADTGAIQMSFPEGTSPAQQEHLYNNPEGMGNLELIPPFTGTDGTRFPHGRVMTGSHTKHGKTYLTSMHLLFDTQGLSPVDIDLTWSASGHIDDVVQVLPAHNDIGFVLAVADARAGFDLLQQNKDVQASMPHPDAAKEKNLIEPLSVANLIKTQQLEIFNQAVAKKTDDVVARLVNQAKFPPQHIVRVPMPYYQAGPNSEMKSWAMFHESPFTPLPLDLTKLDAAPLYADFINGLVVNNENYVYPIPWGPLVGGKDVFQNEYEKILASLQVTGHAMDTWWSHHVDRGDVHCGTNALRDASQKWWQASAGIQGQNNINNNNNAAPQTTTHTHTTSNGDQPATQVGTNANAVA